ncbi:hypothetical protein SANT12839_099240 [Streptomyces antimycoticus]|nr:hypothetical protein SANT12839_099240 [Streptomyces antimycoticus]
MLVTPEGHAHIADTPVGPPVGTGIGGYESIELELSQGTLLALYTDGLVESRHCDIDTGLNRLLTTLQPPSTSLEDTCSHVIAKMTTNTSPEDDIALLIARTQPADDHHQTTAHTKHHRPPT